eukprot:2214339-Amphidinium_carterae.2
MIWFLTCGSSEAKCLDCVLCQLAALSCDTPMDKPVAGRRDQAASRASAVRQTELSPNFPPYHQSNLHGMPLLNSLGTIFPEVTIVTVRTINITYLASSFNCCVFQLASIAPGKA